MVFAIDPNYNVKTFEDLRRVKPPITLTTSGDDGTNFIGYTAMKYLEAHGITEADINAWGSRVIRPPRPEQCTGLVMEGQADCLLQEAIMTPWWRRLIETNKVVPLRPEPQALEILHDSFGLQLNSLPASYWKNLTEEIPALDFSDFVIFVRDDMPKEVAYMLTWCLVETRHLIEAQYKRIPSAQSPLTHPLEPRKMCKTPIPLHPGALEYYSRAGYL